MVVCLMCVRQAGFILSQLAMTVVLRELGVVSINWSRVKGWIPLAYFKEKSAALPLGKWAKDADVNKDGKIDKKDFLMLVDTNEHAAAGGAAGFALGLLKGLGF